MKTSITDELKISYYWMMCKIVQYKRNIAARPVVTQNTLEQQVIAA